MDWNIFKHYNPIIEKLLKKLKNIIDLFIKQK